MALGAAPSRIFRLMVGKGIYLSVINSVRVNSCNFVDRISLSLYGGLGP